MLIRREVPADQGAIGAVHDAAFRQVRTAEAGDAEVAPAEVALVETLRGGLWWLPALSLVAVADGDVVGHVVCTRATVGADERPVLGLGPLGVLPAWQGTGVGSALMHAVLGAADAVGEPLVGLLGAPAYYGRFGFRPATEVGVTAPTDGWGRYFLVRTLTAADPTTKGVFHFPPPFDLA